MVIGFPVLLKIPLIAPGGDGEGIRQLQHPGEGVGLAHPGRVLDAHPPGGAVGPAAVGQHISAQADVGPGHLVLLEDSQNLVGGVALGQAPQVNGLPGAQRVAGRAAVRLGALIDGAVLSQLQKPVQLLLGGNPVFLPPGEAPGGDHRGDGDVERVPGAPAVVFRELQKDTQILADLHGLSPGGVEPGDLAVLQGPGELGFQVPDNVLAGVGGGGGALPVGGDEHGGVHGDDLDALLGLVRAHLRAAAREEQDRQ